MKAYNIAYCVAGIFAAVVFWSCVFFLPSVLAFLFWLVCVVVLAVALAR